MCCAFQVQDYKDSLKQKAEHLIIKGFPEKIVKLNELLETSNFRDRDLADVHQVINNIIRNIPILGEFGTCVLTRSRLVSYTRHVSYRRHTLVSYKCMLVTLCSHYHFPPNRPNQ